MQPPGPFVSSRMHGETDEDVLIYVGVHREDSERHITSVISHSCGGRGPDGTLGDLCRGIVIFSAPVTQIIWTEPLPLSIPLLLSAPIGAIFFFFLFQKLHTSFGFGDSFCLQESTAYVFTSPSDVLSPSCTRLQLAVCSRKFAHFFFFFFFNWTPGITLKWLRTARNQEFM